MKICTKCLKNKDLIEFGKQTKTKDGLTTYCRSCINKNRSIIYQNNKLKEREYHRQYKIENPDKFKKYKSNYYQKIKEFKKDDIFYRLTINLRRRLNHSLKRKSWRKNSHFLDYIGCDLKTLKSHIESQFQIGMTWNNWAINGWHIDHIIPLSSAKTIEQLYELSHYTNLQPLWAKDNLIKSNYIKEKIYE